MVVFRLLLFCFLGLAIAKQAGAEPPGSADGGQAQPAPHEPRITFNWIRVDGPFIAMTFDDGPSRTLTPKLLDLLAARQIKATFFVIGQNVAEYPEVIARAVRDGHEIGSHTWSHPNLGRMSDDAVRLQLKRTEDAIVRAAGVRPTLLRPPYGSITPRQKRWIHDQFGYQIVMWDVDPLDWRRPGPITVCNRIVKETRPGSIVLSHDIHAGTIEAMPATLNQLMARGFKFVTVSELIERQTPEPPKAAQSLSAPPQPLRATAHAASAAAVSDKSTAPSLEVSPGD